MDEDVVIDRLKHGLQSWAVAVAVTWARAQWLWRFTTKNKSIPNNHGRLDCPVDLHYFLGQHIVVVTLLNIINSSNMS